MCLHVCMCVHTFSTHLTNIRVFTEFCIDHVILSDLLLNSTILINFPFWCTCEPVCNGCIFAEVVFSVVLLYSLNNVQHDLEYIILTINSDNWNKILSPKSYKKDLRTEKRLNRIKKIRLNRINESDKWRQIVTVNWVVIQNTDTSKG